MAGKRFTAEGVPARVPAVRSQFDDQDFAKALRRTLDPGRIEFESALDQHAWAGGAISLAARMLAATPFAVVKDAPEMGKEIRTAESIEGFRLARERLKLACEMSPRRIRDVSSMGVGRAPETPVERAPNHELQKLFDRPHNDLSRFALWQGACELLLDRGNALIILEGKGTDDTYEKGKVPAAIRLRSQDGWKRLSDDNGFPIGWEFTPSGRSDVQGFEDHEVIHLKAGYVPEGQVWAEMPLKRAEARLSLDLYALAWNKVFFEQGGEAGSTLETDQQMNPTSPEVRAILDMWNARHQGVGRAHKTAILTHGLKLNRSPLGQKDMEFTKLLDSNRDAELASLGFHKAALGATEDINYAIIRDARRSVWTNVILPIAACIEEELFRALFEPVAGGQVYGIFDLSNVQELQDDVSERAGAFQILMKSQVPYNRANEILGMGLPEEDWGDEPLVPVGQVPMRFAQDPFAGLADDDVPLEPAEPAEGGGPAGANDGAENVNADAALNGAQIQAAKDIVQDVVAGLLPPEAAIELLIAVGLSPERAEKIIAAALKFEPKPQPSEGEPPPQPEDEEDTPAEEKAAFGDDFDSGQERREPRLLRLYPNRGRPLVKHASLGELQANEFWGQWWRAVGKAPEKKLRSGVRRYLHQMRAEVLDRVKAVASSERAARALSDQDIEEMLFKDSEWLRRFLDVTTPAWTQAAEGALADLEGELGGVSFKLTDPAWGAWLEAKEVKVQDINDRIRQALRETLAKGVAEGENVTELQERVRQVMGAAAQPYRTLRIARTETAQAANGVRRMGMVAEGVETVQWITSSDEVVRASHQDFEAAGPQGLDVNWVDLSEHARGTSLEGPSDVNGHPSETVNCFLPGTFVSGRFVAGLKARYSGPAWEIQTRRGNRLCVTPNHPVLTADGWRFACEIREGDCLLSDTGKVELGVQRAVDREHGPTLVQEVFQSLAANGRVRASMVGALDLHGDAVFTDGYVDVVGAERVLTDCAEAGLGEGVGDLTLVTADAVLSSVGTHRSERFGVEGVGAASPSGPGSLALPDDSGSVVLQRGPFESLRLGSASDWDVVCSEDAKNRCSADPVFSRELIRCSAGQISLDEVVFVRRIDFSGHVYDLETEGGWMVASGIVSGNCRCTIVASE